MDTQIDRGREVSLVDVGARQGTNLVAAIYVRVSTDTEAQRLSPEHQLETCLEYAQSCGFVSSPNLVYNDAGLSGMEMAHRPSVQRLVNDARNGQFDVVLFTAISRFARDLSDALALKKRLETVYGVRMVSIEEGYDTAIEGQNNEMVFTVHAMLAAHKSVEMSKAIRRGLRQSARAGRHIGNIAPYGYRKSQGNRLEPNPRTAPIVRDIFRDYADGQSTKAIADALNDRGIPTSTSLRGTMTTLWQVSTILRILKNPVYQGTLIANRWRQSVDIQASREANRSIKRQQERPKTEWVEVAESHEPLVDAPTWGAVQARLRQQAGRTRVKRDGHPLQGMLYCAHCGGRMVLTGRQGRLGAYQYAVCSRVRRIGKMACENHRWFRFDTILRGVLVPVSQLEFSASAIEGSLIHIRNAHAVSNLADPWEDVGEAILQNKARQQALLRTFTGGWLDEDMFYQHIQELRDEEKRLGEQRTQLVQVPASNRAIPEAEIKSSLSGLSHLLSCDPATVQHVLDLLVDRIVCHPNGRVAFIYRCAPCPAFSSFDASLT